MPRYIVFSVVTAIDPSLPAPVPVHAVLVGAANEQAATRAVVESHAMPAGATDYRCVEIESSKRFRAKRNITVDLVASDEPVVNALLAPPTLTDPPVAHPAPVLVEPAANGGTG